MTDEHQVRERLDFLKKEIRQITDREITIIAVTKTHPESILDICANLEIRHIGENRIQELRSKIEKRLHLRNKFVIHCIGPVQSNKAKYLPGLADSLDSLDSFDLIEKINDRWDIPEKLNVLLQINCTSEEQKSGLSHDDKKSILNIANKCLQSGKISLQGFMTMGPTPLGDEDTNSLEYQEKTRKAFIRLKNIRDEVSHELGVSLPRLSMGMTHDYKIAIECGSTEIRVGSLLFGFRQVSGA